MTIKEKTTKIIQNSSLTDNQKQNLIERFYYHLVLATSNEDFYKTTKQRHQEEESAGLGKSKLNGRPQLPKDFKWPEGYYFLAQLNLWDLKSYDVEEFFPDHGMLYLFKDPYVKDYKPYSKTAAKIYYYDGSAKELELRPYPEKSFFSDRGKFYYDEYVNKPSRIKYQPSFMFRNKDEIEVPDELIKVLKEGLELKYDNGHASLLGQPETCEQPVEELFSKTLSKSIPGKALTMVFQQALDHGLSHFWVEKEDLKKPGWIKTLATFSIYI